jgi:large subunit ribosomal protein L9
MKVLLKEDVDNLGSVGDEVSVRDGYGRNFLVPRGKAVFATPKNRKAFGHQKAIVQRKVKKLKLEAETLAEQIRKVPLTVVKKVGEQGKLFGAVTSQDIYQMLKEKGIEVDRRKILLQDPIKTPGDHKVAIKLHGEVTVSVVVSVVKEEAPAEAPSQEGKNTEATADAQQPQEGKKRKKKEAPAS